MSLRGAIATWQSPAVQFDFVDAYINMEHVGCTMLIGAKQWSSAVLEIATSGHYNGPPRNDMSYLTLYRKLQVTAPMVERNQDACVSCLGS